MNKTIEVSEATYDRLRAHIRDFHETEENIITRLLNYYDGTPEKKRVFSQVPVPVRWRIGRDHSQYRFKAFIGNKGQVVLEIVRHYIKENDIIKYEDLLKAFPQDLQGSLGIIKTVEDAEDYVNRSTNHNLERSRFIWDGVPQLSDGTKFVVCNQWSTTLGGFYNVKQNFPKFRRYCKEKLNYEIERVDGEFELN